MTPRSRISFRSLFRIRVFIPLAITAALLLFAFSITDVPNVIGKIRLLSFSSLTAVAGLAAIYLLLKGLEFSFFLRSLGFSTSWRRMIRAYAIGELCITIPSGIYVQNYFLNRVDSVSFARSAGATTTMLVIEGFIILLTLMVLAIPGWAWLRLVIVLIFVLIAVALAALGNFNWPRALRVPMWPHHWMHTLSLGILKLVDALRCLGAPRILAPGILLSAGYLAALVLAFQQVAHGVGVVSLSLIQATSVYFFSLAVVMTVGAFLSQVGIIEVAGLGAARAWGYNLNEAFAMLLGFRIVWTAAMWVFNGAVLLLVPGETPDAG